MSTLWITELDSVPRGRAGEPIPVGHLPPVAEQTVTFTTTAAESSAFNSRTSVVRVHSDAACSIAVGSDPTATASNLPMASGAPEYFGVSPGDKLSVIQRS